VIFNNSLALHARSTLLAAELKLAAQRHKTRERTKEYMADSCFGCCRSLISAYILSLAITERVTRRRSHRPPLSEGQSEDEGQNEDEEKSESDHAHPTRAGAAVGSQIRLSSQSAASRQPVGTV